jgi:hypothetical protein
MPLTSEISLSQIAKSPEKKPPIDSHLLQSWANIFVDNTLNELDSALFINTLINHLDTFEKDEKKVFETSSGSKLVDIYITSGINRGMSLNYVVKLVQAQLKGDQKEIFMKAVIDVYDQMVNTPEDSLFDDDQMNGVPLTIKADPIIASHDPNTTDPLTGVESSQVVEIPTHTPLANDTLPKSSQQATPMKPEQKQFEFKAPEPNKNFIQQTQDVALQRAVEFNNVLAGIDTTYLTLEDITQEVRKSTIIGEITKEKFIETIAQSYVSGTSVSDCLKAVMKNEYITSNSLRGKIFMEIVNNLYDRYTQSSSKTTQNNGIYTTNRFGDSQTAA